jgi:beta-lactamase regulating signal transducer with metallopeptidase domain
VGGSLLFALAMWYYTLWLTIAFFKRRVVPKHYIIWLLISLLLAIKAFAFSPVSDVLAVASAAVSASGRRAAGRPISTFARVKRTFVNP